MARPDRAQRTEVPQAARAAAGPSDGRRYEVAFQVAVPDGAELRPSEQWIRATFEEAPRRWRWFLIVGWTALTCRLHLTRSPSRVLGWQVEHASPSCTTITVQAWVGLTSRIVTVVDSASITLSSSVEFSGPAPRLARIVWTMTVPLHERVLPHLLTAAARRAHASSRSAGR